MSDWGWVTVAYSVVYATLAGYAVSVMSRIRARSGAGDQ